MTVELSEEEIRAASWRIVQCANLLCPLPRQEVTIRPVVRGVYLLWPLVQCICGDEPEVVDWQTPYGRRVSLASRGGQ